MTNLFLILSFVSFIGLIVGLVNPSIFKHIIKREVTRKKIGLVFGIALSVFFVLAGVVQEPEENIKQTQSEKTIETKGATEKEVSDVVISETESTQNNELVKPATKPKPAITPATTPATTPEPTPTPTPEPEPTPETETDRDKMIEIFKENALAEWGSDYEMVNYEVKNQTEAYDWVVKQTKYSAIMQKAKQEWGNDYEMIKYEYENQVEDYEWIIQQTAYPNIMDSAKAEWGNDYEMVKYEYENQVEAYKWIIQQTAYPNIMDSAKAEWGTDYEMVKYEYENQVEAYESL